MESMLCFLCAFDNCQFLAIVRKLAITAEDITKNRELRRVQEEPH